MAASPTTKKKKQKGQPEKLGQTTRMRSKAPGKTSTTVAADAALTTGVI